MPVIIFSKGGMGERGIYRTRDHQIPLNPPFSKGEYRE